MGEGDGDVGEDGGGVGDTELAPIHQCNVAMYSVNSHTCLWKRTCMTSFVLPTRGSGVLVETKGD